jgi:ABC-type transport system involved in cytochrome bd biosynthesis fused ATPase/permease subunit
MNPFQLLFRSRKFWLLVLDIVVSTITLLVSTYFQASGDFILKLIAIYQPLFVFMITAICVEDAAAKSSGTFQSNDNSPVG